jgi:hypothetical protein
MPENLLSPNNHLLELSRRSGLRFVERLTERSRAWVEKLYPLLALLFAPCAVLATSICAAPLFIPQIIASGGQVPTELTLLPDANLNMAILLIVSFAPIYFLVWGWLFIFERRHLWTIGLELPGAAWKYLRGALIGFVMFSASVGIFAAMGFAAFETGSSQPQGLGAIGGIIVVLIGWVVQGAGEEVLTRGFLLPIISTRYGTLAGIILSSGLFMALHLLNPNLSPIALINLFLFGVFASFYALYEGGLWGVFAIHTIWNWVQGNVYGFQVSGGELTTATLFNLQEVGPDWLTGGAFGPEGGLAVTIVLVASCTLVWIAQQWRARQM